MLFIINYGILMGDAKLKINSLKKVAKPSVIISTKPIDCLNT